MSANNATYLLRADWAHTYARLGGLATATRVETKFFVFQGDADMWGELTRKGKLTKQAMWALLMTADLRIFDNFNLFDNAKDYAIALELRGQTEYGLMELTVTYTAK